MHDLVSHHRIRCCTGPTPQDGPKVQYEDRSINNLTEFNAECGPLAGVFIYDYIKFQPTIIFRLIQFFECTGQLSLAPLRGR